MTDHFNGQSLARELVEYDQQLELTTVLRPLGQEVIGAHVIAVGCTTTHAAVAAVARQTSPLMLCCEHLHVLLLPQPMDTSEACRPA